MKEWFKIDLTEIFTVERLFTVMYIILTILLGLIIIKILTNLLLKIFKKKITPQTSLIIRKTILYGGLVLITMLILKILNIELTPLLGAAGIVGIAVGFASQTSISNLISGLFLISEKPFAVGDVISIGTTTGVIISIDLLSVKIRTFDNRFVRIPNEKILNNELTNVTRFPIRRMDIDISIAYKEDVRLVRKVLMELARNNPLCLDEPEPILVFKNFGNSGLEFMLGLWFVKTDFMKLKNSIMQEIKERFDQEGIEIPFPHHTIYTGLASAPFPIRIVNEKTGSGEDIQ